MSLSDATRAEVIDLLQRGLTVPQVCERLPHVHRSWVMPLVKRFRPGPESRIHMALEAQVKRLDPKSPEMQAYAQELLARDKAKPGSEVAPLLQKPAVALHPARPEPVPHVTPDFRPRPGQPSGGAAEVTPTARQQAVVEDSAAPATTRRPVGPKRPALSTTREHPMPTTTALERARELRAEQETVVEQLQAELEEYEGRCAQIRTALLELGAGDANPVPAARPRRKKQRVAPVRKAGPRKGAHRGGTPAGYIHAGSLTAKVLEVLKGSEVLTVQDIAQRLKLERQKVGVQLAGMAKAGHVERVALGQYRRAAA